MRDARDFRWLTAALIALCLGLAAGCATSFKYQPKHDATYAPISNNRGVEITSAQDLRPEGEKEPEWSRKVEVIVARATADELKYSKLFQRVKIHLSGPLPDHRYSH